MSDPEEVGDGWGDELDDLPEVPAPTEQNAELEQLRERLQESEELRAKEREELQSRLQEVMQKAKDRIMEMQSRMTEMQETLQERDSQLDRLQSVGLPAAEVCELGSEAQVSAELALREELEQCREKLARLREESESRLAAAADHDRMQEELAQCRKELEEQRKESAARLADVADQDRLQEELAQCRKELEEQRQESAARLADAAGQDQLSDELEKLREESEKRSAEAEEHAKAREELLQCGSELERLREELATRQEELERRTEELQDCRTELAKLQTAERPAEEDVPPRPRESDELAECRAELAQLHEESESRLSDVVRKSKEHLLSLQTRLEAAVSENAELLEKQKEAEEVQQQQQEKLAKMRQLVAKANDRISESESREKALSESLSKAQSQRLSLQEQIGSLEKNFSMPPSREEIEQRGGILLAVETDSDDVWCLVSTGLCPDESATAVEEVPSIQKRVRWWLLSQLDVAERPVPMQRRWKGEVSALRAQMQRFKKRAEDLQEEYDAYKDKANAALQNSALQSQELQLKERQAEHQGEQLQGMALEMQRMQADKARMSDEVHDMRRQLREADARRADLERSLERKVRESDERGKAEVQSCRTSLEGKMDELERGWRERERALRQELDLRRAQKEALDEEVASLRSLLESHAAATKAAETAAAEAAAAAAAAAAKERAEAEKAPSPVAELPASLLPPSDMPVAEPQPQVARSDSTATAAPAQAESALPPQAYSLHTSVAWQDLVSLRSQVRQLEAQMKEEQERHMVSLQESDRARKQLQNYIDEHRLEQTVGQHQHMEYIRNVFRKFVEMLPANSAETEQLVQVLMTFFQFSSEDAAAIQAKRGAARKQGLWRLF